MLEFIQIPWRDIYEKKRAYVDYKGHRYQVQIEHATGRYYISRAMYFGVIAVGTFVEKHGLTYLVLEEPTYYA